MLLNIKLRDGEQGDLPFIYDTWINSFRKSSEFTRKIHRKVYEQQHRQIVNRCLHRPTVRVTVACDANDPSVIYGYMVWERGLTDRDVVHYVYVKATWQKAGVATHMLTTMLPRPDRIFLSHYTFNRRSRDGQILHAGGEVLLAKWPLADDRKREEPGQIQGNIYCPYLM